jgi:hypothetical protein
MNMMLTRLPDVLMASLAVAMVALLLVGAVLGARRAGCDASEVQRAASITLVALSAWLAIAAVLAMSGLLSEWSARPPRWPLLPLTAFAAIVAVIRSAAAQRVLSNIPPAWPIGAQTFRIGVELALYALYVAGRAPIQVTFEGRNFDVLVGLSAPFVAWLVARRGLGPKSAIAWNAMGLAVLANTVGTVATSTPGPLHVDWPGPPLTAITSWPIVWLPAFLMPLAVFLHVVSLRQNIGRVRAAGAL